MGHLAEVTWGVWNVNNKHILLILLLVDCGMVQLTSSLERILTGHGKDIERTWKGTYDMKEKEVDAHVTKWNDRAGNDSQSKTIPKGLENPSYYHYHPLTNHVFGLLSKNALVSQEKNIVCGFWGIFSFKMTWQEKWQGHGKTWRERTWKQLKRPPPQELDSLASELKEKERQRQ